MNTLAALILFCAADMPAVNETNVIHFDWRHFDILTNSIYPLQFSNPVPFRIEGILTNFVTNVVSSIDREPETKCPVCGGKSHHLCQERTITITPQFTLRIITAGKDGVSSTNDVLLAKGEPVTRKETNLVERPAWPQNTWTNMIIVNPTNIYLNLDAR